jgi:uncharacterized protein (DUF924 family)
MSDPVDVLDFWLGEVGPEGWYAGGEALDAAMPRPVPTCGRRRATAGWTIGSTGPVGQLAFIIVTDQFPRNMWRGSARGLCHRRAWHAKPPAAIAAGWDMDAPEPERQFFYLPLRAFRGMIWDQPLNFAFPEPMPETGAPTHLHARAHAADHRRVRPVSLSQRGPGAGKHHGGGRRFWQGGLWRDCPNALRAAMTQDPSHASCCMGLRRQRNCIGG